MKILVTTYPFGDLPKKQLNNYDVHYNDVLRKYTQEEIEQRLKKYQPDIIIAGTENYEKKQLDLVPDLKIIARVGIGLDSVNLEECKKRNIIVTYTPDAPSNAVAELTICQMLNMLRHVQIVDRELKKDNWVRYIGKDLRDCNIGVIGCGRIGKLVIDKLQGLKPRRIYANDIITDRMHNLYRTEPLTKDAILAECDIITIHIPNNKNNYHYIDNREFELMKKNAYLINMSRGGIVCENNLLNWLKNNKEATAAVDTYIKEPYKGRLKELDNAYLTPHLGSCTIKSRFDMEMGAVEDVLNYINNKDFINRIV